MKILKILMSLMVLILLLGCNSDDDLKTEESTPRKGTLIFGWFADSSCTGACADIYKIENEKIYKDVDSNYPENTFFEGNFQLMTHANPQEYKALLAELPNEIFNQPNGYLSCTDCTNAAGGFYLEFKGDDGFHRSWRFRNASFPNYMENYRRLLLDKIAKLNSL